MSNFFMNLDYVVKFVGEIDGKVRREKYKSEI